MERWKLKAVEFITGLTLLQKPNPSVIRYYPQKTSITMPEEAYFRRSAPEKHGISSLRLIDMILELEDEDRAKLHNMLVIKDGEIICECSAPGYSPNIFHLSHSMSKTVTGMAIGFLVDEGRLSINTYLTDLFPEYKTRDKRFKNITVKHLLTMSTGVMFSEAGSVTEENWTEAFFASKLAFNPGSMFAYNSMNSYILAKIVTRISGMSLVNFLTPRLFAPLHISNFFWEKGPEGVEKGGWGLFLSAESWAKLGYMMLNKGVFENRRILSRAWVEDSVKMHGNAPDKAGDYNYGYQLWVSRTGDDFLFNGMLGQNVWICPKNNIVVVINSENNELMQKSPALAIIKSYLNTDTFENRILPFHNADLLRGYEMHFFRRRHWVKAKKPLRGLAYRLGLKYPKPFDTEWLKVLGTYTFVKNNHSILPLFIRLMQNNFTGGIESVRIEKRHESLFFTSCEGGICYKFEVGLYEFKTTVLNINGEKYLVKAIGEAIEDEERNPIFKIELVFPEMPNSRRIKLNFNGKGRLVMRLSEIPDQKLAEPLVESLYVSNPTFAFAISLLEKRIGDKFILRKLESMFAPSLIGANTDSNEYAEIIESESLKLDEEQQSTKGISSAIMKLTKDNDDNWR